MQYIAKTLDPVKQRSQCVIVSCYEKLQLSPSATAVDKASGGQLTALLKREDFVQEGWRIGPADPAKPAAEDGKDLTFKGVVYNEMKGQMSDASYLFYTKFQERIFPALNNSGGDPQHMTNLTYDDLKTFHKNHYHASNAKIFTYGDIPWQNHLVQLNAQLSQCQPGSAVSEIKLPIDIKNAMFFEEYGPMDPVLNPTSQNKVSLSWILGDSGNISESFGWGVLNSLLLDGYSSPFYEALIASGLGTDFTPNTGVDLGSKKGILSIGLNGVQDDEIKFGVGRHRQSAARALGHLNHVARLAQALLNEARHLSFVFDHQDSHGSVNYIG